MKNIKKALKVITLSSILCISLSAPIFADSSNALIEIERYQQPSGGWQPGDAREIKFAIKNNTTNKDMTVSKIYIIEKSKMDILDAFKEMTENTSITIKDGETIIKESISLEDMLKNEANLDKKIVISPGKIKELTMLIDMNTEMDNKAQGLSKVFSLGTVYSLSSTGGGGGTIEPPINPEEPEPPINPEQPEPPIEPPINPEEPEPPINPPINPEPGNPDNENNGSNVGGDEDKLPQTGGLINGTSLTVLGLAVAGLGIVLDRKSSDKGGKSDE